MVIYAHLNAKHAYKVICFFPKNIFFSLLQNTIKLWHSVQKHWLKVKERLSTSEIGLESEYKWLLCLIFVLSSCAIGRKCERKKVQTTTKLFRKSLYMEIMLQISFCFFKLITFKHFFTIPFKLNYETLYHTLFYNILFAFIKHSYNRLCGSYNLMNFRLLI